MLTSVAVQQPNVLGLIAAVAQGKELVALSAVVPGDVDPEEYFKQQETLFEESQNIAAAAAAKAAGMEVQLTGNGASVNSVTADSPAEGKLEPGDVIVAIDGKRIRLADDVVRTIRSRPDGTKFRLGIERDDEEREVTLESRSGIVRGAPGIGVLLETKDFDVDLPFEIKFRKREIGGPSAGLAYAMAVYDLLEEENIADGRDIATTGTVDLEGNVGPIGGVEDKAIAATRAGAELFLVPEEEVGAVDDVEDLKVLGVSTLQGAVESLS
jgi:PDZ domain-containing protein